MPRFARRLAVVGATAVTVVAGLLGAAPTSSAATTSGVTAGSARPSAATTSSTGAAAAYPGTYVPLTPTRLLDTRSKLGASGPATPAHPVVTFPVLGRGGVPSTGVASVAVTVTVVGPTAAGWVGHGQVSSINFTAGQILANLVVLPVGADGTVSLTVASSGTTQLVADVAGIVRSGAATMSGTVSTDGGFLPSRLLDTRTVGAVPAGGSTRVDVSHVTEQGAGAVLMNLTVTGTSAAGYLSAYPDGTTDPGTSSLNFLGGQTVANYAVVRAGADDEVVVANHSPRSVQIIADVDALTLPGDTAVDGAVLGAAPSRLLDTRSGRGAAGPVAVGRAVSVKIAGVDGLPTSGVSAVVLNVTATQSTAGGFVSAYPGGTAQPGTSMLNYGRGQTVADTVVVPVGTDGTVSLTPGGTGTVQLVADLEGYVRAGATPPAPVAWTSFQPSGLTNAALGPISCPTLTFCMQASRTAQGNIALQTYDGTSWSPAVEGPMGYGAPRGLTCVSPTFCVLNTESSALWTWDGRQWTSTTVRPPAGATGFVAFSSVSCTSASFCVATDDVRGAATTWNGTGWSTAVLAQRYPLAAVSCTSPTFCLAVGGYLEKNAIYDGTTWHQAAALPAPTDNDLGHSVSCVSPTYCVALTGSATTTDEYFSVYDGESWSTPEPTSLAAWSTSVIQCFAVGDCVGAVTDGGGGDVVAHFDGSTWSTTHLDPASDGAKGMGVVGLSCSDAQHCVATDWSGRMFVEDGTTWSGPTPVLTVTGWLISVACGGPSFCIAGTGNGDILTYDGTGWSPPSAVVPGRQMTTLACASTTFCLAGDDDGGVLVWDGARWGSETVVDPGRSVTSSSCWAPGSCIVGDDHGQVVMEDDGTWGTPFLLPTGSGPTQVDTVSCTSVDFCAATTHLGVLVVERQGRWTVPQPPANYTGVSCSSTTCLANSVVGRLVELHPDAPDAFFITSAGDPYGAWLSCTPSGRCLVLSGGMTAGDVGGGPWTTPAGSPLSGHVSCVDPGVCAVVNPYSLAVAHLA